MKDLEEIYATHGDMYNGYIAESDYVKNWIKDKSISDPNTQAHYIELLRIEKHIQGKARGFSAGHMRMSLEQKYPKEWEAIRNDLDPNYHERRKRQEEEKQKKEQREAEQRARGRGKDKARFKKVWLEQGGNE